MASSTAPAPALAAASVRVTKSECRNVVEVVVPILHDTLRAAIEAADEHLDERLLSLTVADIGGLQSKLDQIESDTFVYALLLG